MRPQILQCLPKAQLDWVELRAQAGTVDPRHVLIFYAYKLFSPGSPDEKDALIKRILNPNVCTHPASAQIEVLRWKTGLTRLASLPCSHPAVMLA